MTASWRWLDDDPDGAIKEAATELAQGNCVVFPTDTVYGLLAAITAGDAYKQIYRIKHRPTGKPLALLSSHAHPLNIAVSAALEAWPDATREYSRGTLTVIVSEADLPTDAIPHAVASCQPGPLGVRLPYDRWTQQLLTALGGLAWATSVNKSGQSPAVTIQQLQNWSTELGDVQPALIVARRQPLAGTPSRLANLESGNLRRLDRAPT